MSLGNDGPRSWREIAIDVIGETNRKRFQKLLEELDSALAAQAMTSSSHSRPAENSPYQTLRSDPGAAYEKIVDGAVAIMRSDFASVQMLYPERGSGGELQLLAFRGFNPDAAKFWEWVRADSKSTCGMALRSSQRVVASDIAACDFMRDSEDQQVYLQTGIHACQTTPLISRSGDIVGMISTHWRTPHQPSEDDFRFFDVLAKQAADLVFYCRQEQGVQRRERSILG